MDASGCAGVGTPRVPDSSSEEYDCGLFVALGLHFAAPVRQWIAKHSEAISVFFLPPYSPELNPDEYLNSDFKRDVYTDIPAPDQATLHRQALGHLRRIQRSPARVAAYFKHPAIRDAA
ncbi:MAG: transposase [Holophagales bacterium]|nr:MAG: transposase [Holophagales bacterium]